SLAPELAVGADLARHARHLRGEDAHLLDHRVDDPGGAQELALERTTVHLEAHRLREVALGHRRDRSRDLRRRPQQILDERIDGGLHASPGATVVLAEDALARLSAFSDTLPDALQLAGARG